MASADTPKTVELYGYGVQNEAEALSAITPGMLIERASGGVQAHSTAGETASPAFAVEHGMLGRTISDGYADGEQVIYKTFCPGSGVYALAHAGGAAIAQYAFLKSGGDGTLELAGDDEVAIAQAMEAVDNSGGGSAVRIKVEIIPAQRTAPGA